MQNSPSKFETIFIVSVIKIGLFPNFQQLKCDLSNIATRISIRAIVRAVWRMSKTFKSNTINHKNSLQFFNGLEPSCKFWGCYPKASQDWKVACNLMPPFDVKFSCGNGVAKTVVSYSKVKIFRCWLQKMKAGCRILGAQFAEYKLFYLGFYLHTYDSDVVCAT